MATHVQLRAPWYLRAEKGATVTRPVKRQIAGFASSGPQPQPHPHRSVCGEVRRRRCARSRRPRCNATTRPEHGRHAGGLRTCSCRRSSSFGCPICSSGMWCRCTGRTRTPRGLRATLQQRPVAAGICQIKRQRGTATSAGVQCSCQGGAGRFCVNLGVASVRARGAVCVDKVVLVQLVCARAGVGVCVGGYRRRLLFGHCLAHGSRECVRACVDGGSVHFAIRDWFCGDDSRRTVTVRESRG